MRKNSNNPFGIGYYQIELENYNKIDNKIPYKIWERMFTRSYSKEYKSRNQSYEHCYVDKPFHLFQDFAKWYYNNLPKKIVPRNMN